MHGFRFSLVLIFLILGQPRMVPAAEASPSQDMLPVAGLKTAVHGMNRTIADLKIELIWIKPGAFTLGSPPDEPGRNRAEGPQTIVTLTKGFWLGKTPVTQAQYEAFTGKNPSAFKTAGSEAPVETVSWLDAMKFCEDLNVRERTAGRLPEGYEYSLPTEAQWEYACRAGTKELSFFGNVAETSWFDANSGGKTHPVAQLKPNPWGLFDMTGNVLQWCYDWYGDYPGGSVMDPTGPDSGYYRMARGGSWRMSSSVCRSAARAGGSPARLDYTLGFRLALTPKISKRSDRD